MSCVTRDLNIKCYKYFLVKNNELHALGYFVKRFSYLVDDVQKKEIKAIFWITFQKEINNPKISQKILCGFFKGFMYYCEIYHLRKENVEDNKIIKTLYTQIKNLAIFREEKEKTRTIKIANRGE